jgi:hypothetical protein
MSNAFTLSLSAGWFRLSDGTLSTGNLTQVMFTLISTQGTVGFTPVSANAGQVLISAGSAQTRLYPAVQPTEFQHSILPWSSTRTTASAALFTNVTQVLNKGGTVLAGRLSPESAEVWTFTSLNLQNLHPAEKAYLALESGAYSFVPPSTDLTDFYDYTSPNSVSNFSSSSTVPVFRLDNASLVSALVFTPAAGVSEALAINLDWHIEFRTTSALFEIGMSTATIESLHQAQLALASVGYFFPNATHKSVLNKVASGATGFLKWALPYAAAAPGMVGMAGKAGQFLLSAKPKPNLKPTSGQTSGIVSTPKAKPKGGNASKGSKGGKKKGKN